MESRSSGESGAALVTGASRGLGRVIVTRLARSGFPVAVNYRSSEAEALEIVRAIRRAGGTAAPLQADMSRGEEATALIARAEEALGALTVVVANAGITRDRLLVQMSEADWTAIWDTDLSGPLALCREALGRMRPRGYGRVVTVGSVVGMTGNPGQANYAAAKSALQGMTRGLAVEAASSGVTVNCVVPGFFATDATAHLSEERRTAWFSRIPMGRGGSPDDVAALVDFLAGPNAGYITGQCIAVDGGYLARWGGGLDS